MTNLKETYLNNIKSFCNNSVYLTNIKSLAAYFLIKNEFYYLITQNFSKTK